MRNQCAHISLLVMNLIHKNVLLPTALTLTLTLTLALALYK